MLTYQECAHQQLLLLKTITRNQLHYVFQKWNFENSAFASLPQFVEIVTVLPVTFHHAPSKLWGWGESAVITMAIDKWDIAFH